MKILLIGGNGYVGSKIYAALKDQYDILSIDLCLFGKDLGYSTKVNYANIYNVAQHDVIICLAGHSSVQMSQFDSLRSWENNVTNFISLCEKLNSSQKLIYASSASVYSAISGVAHEESPINFDSVNNYDMQKIAVDLIASRYVKLGKNIVGLRFGTVNGAAPNTRGELMLNSMVRSAIQNGAVYAKNMHIRRSILGINDALGAIHKLIEMDIPPGPYNLSSFSSTVKEMSEIVSNKLGVRLVVENNDATYYDYAMSSEKFSKVANYKFVDTIDSLVDGLVHDFNNVHFDARESDRDYAKYR